MLAKSDIDKMAEKYAKEVNEVFHSTFRTRWNITNMTKRVLKKMAKEINDKHKFE